MKRDMELIKKILQKIEDQPGGRAPRDMSIEGYTSHQVAHHIHLAVDANLVRGHDITHNDSEGPEACATSLTNAGHDFLAVARDETIWKKGMAKVKELGGAMTLTLLKKYLEKLLSDTLGLDGLTVRL